LNKAEVGGNRERFPLEKSGDSTSTEIPGEYCGLLFVREWEVSELRGRLTGDEGRARADQVLPLEGTVKGATGRARGLTGPPPLPATPSFCHYEALQEAKPNGHTSPCPHKG
jgi:hypothetical protein